jgi:hypothetical protein
VQEVRAKVTQVVMEHLTVHKAEAEVEQVELEVQGALQVLVLLCLVYRAFH